MTVEEQLDAALARYPRGLPLGFAVKHESEGREQSITLAAFQEWRARNRLAEVVGLVWLSRCACSADIRQLTGNRPKTLRTVCAKCDVVGTAEPMFDEAVACAVLPPAAEPYVRKRGPMLNHVLDVACMYPPEVRKVAVDAFVSKAAALLSAPEEGARDTRRQHVTRALHALCKEKDPVIAIRNGMVLMQA